MKTQELRKLIREEVRKVVNEIDNSEVIGKTQSGKPIHFPNAFRNKNSDYYIDLVKNYTKQDHTDAAKLNKDKYKSLQPTNSADQLLRTKYFATARYHAMQAGKWDGARGTFKNL